MTFNLPPANVLFTTTTASNRGTLGSPTGNTKFNGWLPITSVSTEMVNNKSSNPTGDPSITYFGLDGQTSTTEHDVSDETEVMVGGFQFNAPNRIQVATLANEGVSISLINGQGSAPFANYEKYYIAGNDTPVAFSQTGVIPYVIDLNIGTGDASAGTLGNTGITGMGFGHVRFNIAGTNNQWIYQIRMFLFGTTKNSPKIPNFTGTTNWSDAFVAVQGTNYTSKIGSWLDAVGTVYFVPCPFQFGDGTTPTIFTDDGATIVSPGNNVPGSENFRLTTQAMRVYYSMPDNSTATLTGTYVWGSAAPWDFNESNDSVCTIRGATFSGMGNFTCGSSVIGGATFSLSSGSEVIINGANLNGSIINGDCILNSDTDLSDMTISGDLIINVPSDTIINLSNVTVDGNIWNNSPNTLTVNASNGSSVTAGDPGTGNSYTNLVNTVTLTVNCTRDDTGTPIPGIQIYILSARDRSVLSSGSTDDSGIFTNTVYNYTTDQNVIIVARLGTLPGTVYVPDEAGNTIRNTGMTQFFLMVEDVNNN